MTLHRDVPSSPSLCDQRTSESLPMLALNKRGLVLKDGQGLLEAADLLLAPPAPLCVSFGLGDASVLDLAVELEHRAQLCVRGIAIRRILRDGRVQRLGLL